MTENEIRKALERCSANYNCGDCPYYYDAEECPDPLMNDALDLINRQKVEVEQLKIVAGGLEQALKNVTAEVDRLLKECESKEEAYNKEFCLRKELKAEIERLNIRNKTLIDITKNYDWKFARAKSEAIKEFAHLIIGRSRNGVIQISDIPDLVKEMTEENEK